MNDSHTDDVELQRTASFYDAAAASYDADMQRTPALAALRDAFRKRVVHGLVPGNTVLDFGCGTGADASWYAQQGFRVIAYDLSSGMVEAMKRRYAPQLARGEIILVAGDVTKLSEVLEQCDQLHAIAANFAVLNHVRAPAALFELFAKRTSPGARVDALLLNPFFRPDVRRLWWWRGLFGAPSLGAIRMNGAVTTYRHFRRAFAKSAAPGFVVSEWTRASQLTAGVDDNFIFAELRKRG